MSDAARNFLSLARLHWCCVASLLAFLAVFATPAVHALHAQVHDHSAAIVESADGDHSHDQSGDHSPAHAPGDRPAHDPTRCGTCAAFATFAAAADALATTPLVHFEERSHWQQPHSLCPSQSAPPLTSASPRGPPALFA